MSDSAIGPGGIRMRGQVLRGRLVGVVAGPSMILEVRGGEEKKLPLKVELPLPWIESHIDEPVLVMVNDGAVVEVA